MSTSVFLKKDYDGNGLNLVSTSELFTFQSGATALSDGQQLDVSGYATVAVQVSISGGTPTVSFEGSVDGTTYSSVSYATTNSGSSSTTATASNLLRFNVVGLKYFRCRISIYVSGTVTAVGYASTISIPNPAQFAAYGGSDSNSASSTSQLVAEDNLLFNGTAWERQRSAVAATDATTGTGFAANVNWGFNGTTFDRVRVSKKYFYLPQTVFTASTGYTVWAPATGKKFRLMGLSVSATMTGRVFLQDGTNIVYASASEFHAMAFAVAGDTLTFDFGQGYLSAAADSPLKVFNGTTTGSLWIAVWGVEE